MTTSVAQGAQTPTTTATTATTTAMTSMTSMTREQMETALLDAALAEEQSETFASTASLEAIRRLDRDLKHAAAALTPSQARYLVNLYYDIQEERIRAAAQIRASAAAAEPNALLDWMFGNYATLEGDIKNAMGQYAKSKPEGRWLLSITGIGPVLAAGYMAHITIQEAPSPAHIWAFAGLDPTKVWVAKTKRPWNAALKRLAWLTGESFIKSSGRPSSFYGPLYAERKAYEMAQNEQLAYREQAARELATKRYGAETVARSYYEQGKLPPAHIHARARRWTVKLFLAHYWSILWDLYRAEEPKPAPYAIAHLQHVDQIKPPNWPMA